MTEERTQTAKEKVLAQYPRAYINGGHAKPQPWRVYRDITDTAWPEKAIGRGASPLGAWNDAAKTALPPSP